MRTVRFILGCSIMLFGMKGMAIAQTSALPPLDPDSLASEVAKDSIVAQSIESRKGYVARIPKSACLDSTRSGWNPTKNYERRVYVLEKAGEIIFTVTVGPTEIPESATETQAYTYVDHDTLTSAGTAWSRTYYLATRSVSIELIPYGIAMHPYTLERNRIYNSFRWKPGANTDRIDVDSGTNAVPDILQQKGLGK
ncbi:MAG: hypothetical protein J4G05_01970 [Chlorobi bacterium]|nr:hypothetical protein [Chlorobiota bacterium]